jgi:hypothetical protein
MRSEGTVLTVAIVLTGLLYSQPAAAQAGAVARGVEEVPAALRYLNKGYNQEKKVEKGIEYLRSCSASQVRLADGTCVERETLRQLQR